MVPVELLSCRIQELKLCHPHFLYQLSLGAFYPWRAQDWCRPLQDWQTLWREFFFGSFRKISEEFLFAWPENGPIQDSLMVTAFWLARVFMQNFGGELILPKIHRRRCFVKGKSRYCHQDMRRMVDWAKTAVTHLRNRHYWASIMVQQYARLYSYPVIKSLGMARITPILQMKKTKGQEGEAL